MLSHALAEAGEHLVRREFEFSGLPGHGVQARIEQGPALRGGVQRAAEADCSPLVDGDAVRFHYSEWRSRTALENYYGGNTLAMIAAPGGRGDLVAAGVTSRASDGG